MNNRLFLYQFAKEIHSTNPEYVVFGIQKGRLTELHVVHDDKGTAVSVSKKEIPKAIENPDVIALLARKTISKLNMPDA